MVRNYILRHNHHYTMKHCSMYDTRNLPFPRPSWLVLNPHWSVFVYMPCTRLNFPSASTIPARRVCVLCNPVQAARENKMQDRYRGCSQRSVRSHDSSSISSITTLMHGSSCHLCTISATCFLLSSWMILPLIPSSIIFAIIE